ncbi:MAG: hypothetical protein ACKV2T_11800 [Kofleriaceae bacterium]
MKRAFAAIVVVASVSPARADLRFALGNDAFSELVPPLDDVGFTSDLELAFWRPYRGLVLGGRWRDRLITEGYRELTPGDRRQDLIELAGTIEKAWGEPLVHSMSIEGRAGTVVTGNWGGRYYQNGWHSFCRCGATLGEGLADRYVEDRRFGALIGARAVASEGIHRAQAYAALDAQASIGTGVTFVDGAIGGRARHRIGCIEIGAHAELAAMRFHVESDALAIYGGYRAGWQLGWRAGVHVAWGRVRIDYQYRANEGGSGEPIGVVAVTVKQAGTTF